MESMNEELQALEEASKSLFTASESIREALDTIDLKLAPYKPVDGSTIQALEGCLDYLERVAKILQKKARS